MPITLVIADDHPLILDAMENLFRLEKDLKVVARRLNGDEASRQYAGTNRTFWFSTFRCRQKTALSCSGR